MHQNIRDLTDYEDGWRPDYVVGWDTETHLISAENGLTPPVVCLTMAGKRGTLERARWLRDHLDDVVYDETGDGEWTLLIGKGDAGEAFYEMGQACDVMVAHNLAFDTAVAIENGWQDHGSVMDYIECGIYRDTMVREMLLAIAFDRYYYDDRVQQKTAFSLAALAYVYLGKDRSEDKAYIDLEGNIKGDPNSWRIRYAELDGVAVHKWPTKAQAYAIEDAVDARDIFILQGSPKAVPEGTVVTTDGNVVNERAQTQAAHVLHWMAKNGPEADPEAVDAFEAEVQKQADAADVAAKAAGFLRVNKCKLCEGTGMMGSVPALRPCYECKGDPEYLPPRARVPYGKTTLHKARLQAWVKHSLGDFTPMTDPSSKYPQGQVKTDADTLRLTAVPLLHAYAEGLEAKKDLSTYVPILRRAIGHRLLSRPNVLVRSGRTSWKDPNLQNPTGRAGFRECFEAPEGKVFCSTDYNTVELVTLAQTCLDWFGWSRMADAINAGKDLHLAFGADMMQIPYDEAKERKAKGDPAVKEARTNAKVANFGFPGGLGVKTLVEYAQGFGVTLDFNTAQDLRDQWRASWPEMELYFETMSSMANNGLPDAEGRERFAIKQEGTGRIRGGAHYTSACNTQFQGRAADLIKQAAWKLHRLCYCDRTSVLYGVRMWALIHDEILFVGPSATAHLWGPETRRVMVEEGKVFVPDVALNAEEALMRRWSKKAEPAYAELPMWGRALVPYDSPLLLTDGGGQ